VVFNASCGAFPRRRGEVRRGGNRESALVRRARDRRRKRMLAAALYRRGELK
jgi:hypothetical protein